MIPTAPLTPATTGGTPSQSRKPNGSPDYLLPGLQSTATLGVLGHSAVLDKKKCLSPIAISERINDEKMKKSTRFYN